MLDWAISPMWLVTDRQQSELCKMAEKEKAFAAMPEDELTLPRSTWWKERISFHRLFSDLHTCAIKCACILSPKANEDVTQNNSKDARRGRALL